MDQKNLVKILKNHKVREAVLPREAWVLETRALLISRTKQKNAELRDPRRSLINIFATLLDAKALKRATVVFAMVAFVFSSFVGIVSAENSLPGDALYDVKIATEKARVQIASNDTKPLLRTDFAGRRLKEMFQVMEGKLVGKEVRVRKAVGIFQEEMNNVNDDLDALRDTTQADEAVRVAAGVDKKVGEYIDLLKKNEAHVPKLLQVDVKKAKQTVLKTAVKTTEVIVLNAARKEGSEKEAIQSVKDRLVTVANQIADLAPALQATSTPSTILAPAKLALNDARIKFEANDLESAVSLLAKSSALVSSVEDVTASALSRDEATGALPVKTENKLNTDMPAKPVDSKTQGGAGTVANTVKIDLFYDNGS